MSLTLTINETVSKIENLIETGNGDPGRLNYIMDFIKNNKPLYKSDLQYLEKKLNSKISAIVSEEKKSNPDLEIVQKLINSGIGDVGRLQFISEMLTEGKPLYQSDRHYIESKLKETKIKKVTKETTIESDKNENAELKTKLAICNDKILQLESVIEKTKQKSKELGKPKEVLTKLRGTMPKD